MLGPLLVGLVAEVGLVVLLEQPKQEPKLNIIRPGSSQKEYSQKSLVTINDSFLTCNCRGSLKGLVTEPEYLFHVGGEGVVDLLPALRLLKGLQDCNVLNQPANENKNILNRIDFFRGI